LDGGAVVDAGHGVGAGAAGGGFEAAGAGVVVAELGVGEGGRVAALAEGVDVAAEITALRVGCGFGEWTGLLVHGVSPWCVREGYLGAKISLLHGLRRGISP
jgi:hypothetical protein